MCVCTGGFSRVFLELRSRDLSFEGKQTQEGIFVVNRTVRKQYERLSLVAIGEILGMFCTCLTQI